jgi:hypothetical protein
MYSDLNYYLLWQNLSLFQEFMINITLDFVELMHDSHDSVKALLQRFGGIYNRGNINEISQFPNGR